MKKQYQYSDDAYESARGYLRRRLDDEASMRDDVDSLLRYYIPLLVALLMRGARQSEIDALVDALLAELVDDCETLAVDDHDDRRDAILLFLHQDIGGKTIDGRFRERIHTLYDELSVVAIVGLLLGVKESSVVSSILGSLREPWNNPLLVEFREKVQSGEMRQPDGLDVSERHYGHGVPVSSSVALADIAVYGVSASWSYYDYLSHRDEARGYYVFRGSSYPCDECDSHVGYHDISDEGSLPLFHNHCKCYIVWV